MKQKQYVCKSKDASKNLCVKHAREGYDACGCGLPALWQMADGGYL